MIVNPANPQREYEMKSLFPLNQAGDNKTDQ